MDAAPNQAHGNKMGKPIKNPIAKVSQLIRCPVTDAFDAFVDPGRITQFWLTATSAPLIEGADATWQFMVPGATERTRVTESKRPHRIAFDWSDGTSVRLDFEEPRAGETQVAVEVTGFAGGDAVEQALNATEGFAIVLCDLKTLLESGRSANLVRDKARLIVESAEAPKA